MTTTTTTTTTMVMMISLLLLWRCQSQSLQLYINNNINNNNNSDDYGTNDNNDNEEEKERYWLVFWRWVIPISPPGTMVTSVGTQQRTRTSAQPTAKAQYLGSLRLRHWLRECDYRKRRKTQQAVSRPMPSASQPTDITKLSNPSYVRTQTYEPALVSTVHTCIRYRS